MDKLDDGALRLRAGTTVWQADEAHRQSIATGRLGVGEIMTTDVVIVGAGITGAFLAERFTRAGRGVVLIDRREPVTGSTAASTAMLLWELDASLLELEDRLGFDAAARIALQCRQAVTNIAALVTRLEIDCEFTPRPSLYLAGNTLDAADLREEHRIRALIGIEGRYLDEGAVAEAGFAGDAALLYPGSAEADPVKLARGLIAAAQARGAIVLSPATADVYQTDADGVTVATREGAVVRAKTLVLANGYEMPDFVDAAKHALVSSWAVATRRSDGEAWPQNALVWEAADPYLYLRSTADGRIIAGGEDEEHSSADERERLMQQKIAALLDRVAARCPGLGKLDVEYAWSGVFGETDDALPMIGSVPERPSCLAAFGYGGNGITFSAIAAQLLEAELEGRPAEGALSYALDRD
jgi:glycine/D-amino acid oxidase-like deaminating enzyme